MWRVVYAGLGTWRLYLAGLVAISHLWSGMIDGPAAYAVWGFFVLSGYVNTYVLQTRYNARPGSLGRFALNRFLRIYPGYAAAFLMGLVTLRCLPLSGADPAALNPQFLLPHGLAEWLGNLLMLPVPQRALPVPVAAALFTEVGAYALMPLLASGRPAAWSGFIVALTANLQLGLGVDSFIPRYCGFATGLLPFAVGALACHYRGSLRLVRRPGISMMAWNLHGLVWLWQPYWPWTLGLYASVLLSGWVVVSLAPRRSGPMDRLAGDLSYPVYLLHTTVGAWLLPWFGTARHLSFAVAACGLTLLAAGALLVMVDHPIQRLRRSVRDGFLRSAILGGCMDGDGNEPARPTER